MSKKSEEFAVESTPVIDLSKHMLSDGPENFSANDPLESWDNEKTEVYVDSDDDTGNAALLDNEGNRHPITAFPYTLGRGNECDFVLNGKGVSRKHAEIVFQSGRFVINDLQSLNGIKVNGYKVNRVILEEGDAIKLGEVNLTFTSGKEGDTPQKKTKKKPSQAALASADDPFSEGSGKKIVFKLVTLTVVLAIAGGGYYFYMNNQAAMEQRALVAKPTQKPAVVAPQSSSNSPQASQNAPQVAATAPREPQVAKPSAITAPPPKLSPPPSLSQLPVSKPVERLSAPEELQEPVVVAPTPSVKPVPKTPSLSRDSQNAKKVLADADKRYLAGEADSLFADMNRYENNSKVASGIRTSMKAKHEKLAKLYSDYISGKEAHVAGNSDLAFEHWGQYMEREKSYFRKGVQSVYADQVAVKVVEAYVEKGNLAAKNEQHHQAYRYWQKALTLGESVAAKIAIESADAKAKQIYRKALRLEYVNSNQAKQLWQEVVNLVPPGSEYHTKASSKLAWYDRWGA